ncbi:hypothetical protein ACRAWG_27825 [Methylobacterium sp. P31]
MQDRIAQAAMAHVTRQLGNACLQRSSDAVEVFGEPEAAALVVEDHEEREGGAICDVMS